MVKLWTNFATHHDPTPGDKSWPAYGVSGQTYVRLEDSQVLTESDLDRDKRLQFWRNMMNNYM